MPWDIIGKLVLGFWESRKAEKYLRAWLSLIFSAILTFLFVWGATISSLYASVGAVGSLVLGFAAALIATSASILAVLRRTEQFRSIGLFFPSKIDSAIVDLQKQTGTTFDPNKQ